MIALIEEWRADFAAEVATCEQQLAEARAAVVAADSALVPIEESWVVLDQILARYRASEKAKFQGFNGFVAGLIGDQRTAFLTARVKSQTARDLVKHIEDRLIARREAVAELEGILRAQTDPVVAPAAEPQLETVPETQADHEESAVQKFRREYPEKQRTAA